MSDIDMGRVVKGFVLVTVLLSCSGCTEQVDPSAELLSTQPLPESVHAYRHMRVQVSTTADVLKVYYPTRYVRPDPDIVYPILRAGCDPIR